MEMQNNKGKEVCDDIVFRNLSKSAALKKLKPHNHPGNAKNAIINITLAGKEELGEDDIQESEHKHPAYVIMQRNNFCCNRFMGSPMHLMGLELVSAIMSIIYQLASYLNVKKDLSTSVKSAMERLVNSRIDFAPTETLTSNKTIGWIWSDCMRLCKFIGSIFRNMDRHIAEKNHDIISMKNYNPKMCRNYLLLRNLNLPNAIKEKRKEVLKHMQLMKNEINEFNKLSIQPLICSICKLVASIMMVVDTRKYKPRMHYKQCLNAFHQMDALIKKLTNDALGKKRCVSMCNNLNVGDVISDVDFSAPVRFAWEGNWHEKKGTQAVKEQFVSQKEKFGKIIINKQCTKKVLDHPSPEESIELEILSKFQNYAIDSREVLYKKLQTLVPMPFAMIKDSNLLFVFQYSEAMQFKFTDLIDVQMGWFYFNITF